MMTFIQRTSRLSSKAAMDVAPRKFDSGNSPRPVRSRRYTRRSFTGRQPQKKLFTPEIKRYLKDWLVRRRENPYPNREEKKHLAMDTGLTYVQICNWFANWRRKLKNVNADRNLPTWGQLIRTYNDRAHGNVEHFSISSNDSIWSEPEYVSGDNESMSSIYEGSLELNRNDDLSDTSTSSTDRNVNFDKNLDVLKNSKPIQANSMNVTSPLLLSKWLESAARFRPSENNYLWWSDEKRRKTDCDKRDIASSSLDMFTICQHDKDEVEAAVALTALATAANGIQF